VVVFPIGEIGDVILAGFVRQIFVSIGIQTPPRAHGFHAHQMEITNRQMKIISIQVPRVALNRTKHIRALTECRSLQAAANTNADKVSTKLSLLW